MDFNIKRKKIIHQSFDVLIPAGTDFLNPKAQLEKGVVKNVFVFTDGTETDGNNIISLAIRHSTKGYAEQSACVANYKQAANGYEASKPIDFLAGDTKYMEFSSVKPVIADTYLQVVFVIEQEAGE